MKSAFAIVRGHRTCVMFLALSLMPTIGATDETSEDGTSDSLGLLIQTIKSVPDAAIRATLLRGILQGLEGRRIVAAPEGWSELNAELTLSKDPTVRDLATQLSRIFGDKDATDAALKLLQDRKADVPARRKALQSLLALQNKAASSLLESLLDEPAMRLDAIRGYAIVASATGPGVLLGRYQEFDAEHRRAVIETLATRKVYAEAALVALQKNQLARQDIPVHVARSLHGILGKRFIDVYGDLKPIAQDREATIAKYKSLITPGAVAKGNASRGRMVFKKTCAACHVLYGDGGKIGPDLTGSNRANLDYILLNSVDPSYDVPLGYKMVQILTVDGRVVSGVIAEEDQVRLVLKTVEQPRLVIAKEDIEERKISRKSMMPDGQLDQMKSQEVVDLIKYLRTTEQAELPK